MVAQLKQETELSGRAQIMSFINKWQLNYKEAATIFEVDYNTVCRWASGNRSPNAGYLLAAKLFNQTWEEKGKPFIKTY